MPPVGGLWKEQQAMSIWNANLTDDKERGDDSELLMANTLASSCVHKVQYVEETDWNVKRFDHEGLCQLQC